MRVTVLGKSPSWQDAGGACSGYLVEEGGTCLLVDCGNGVFGRLRAHRDYAAVDAVVLSHLHADHFLDLVPYAYALVYAPRQQPVAVHTWPGTDCPARPALHAPAGAGEAFRRVVGAWGGEDLVERAFALTEYRPDEVLEIGALRLRFRAVPHFVPTCAIEIVPAAGGPRLVYGADSAPNDELVAFAQAAELLICEATLPRPERAGPRGHLTPAEAGEHAARAGVGRLVVTHFSDELGEEWVLEQARSTFAGRVDAARADAVFEL